MSASRDIKNIQIADMQFNSSNTAHTFRRFVLVPFFHTTNKLLFTFLSKA